MFSKNERVLSVLTAAEGIFNTVKHNIPDLHRVTNQILEDVRTGKLDE